MKHNLLFAVMILADLMLLPTICLLWKSGAPLVWPLFIAGHILLGRLNERIGKTRAQRLTLGVAHVISTLCAHLLFQWLWSTHVYHGRPDGETIGAFVLAVIAGLSISVYLMLCGLNSEKTRRGKGA